MKRRYRIKQEDGSTPRLATVWLPDHVHDDDAAPLLDKFYACVLIVGLHVMVFLLCPSTA